MPPRRRVIQENNIEEDKKKDFEGYTKIFDEFGDNDIYIVMYGKIVEADEDQENAFNDLQDGIWELDKSPDNVVGQQLIDKALSEGMALQDQTVIYIDKNDQHYLVLAKIQEEEPPLSKSSNKSPLKEEVSSSLPEQSLSKSPLEAVEEIRSLTRQSLGKSPLKEEARSLTRQSLGKSPLKEEARSLTRQSLGKSPLKEEVKSILEQTGVDSTSEISNSLNKQLDKFEEEKLDLPFGATTQEEFLDEITKLGNAAKFYPLVPSACFRQFLLDNLLNVFYSSRRPDLEDNMWMNKAYIDNFDDYATRAKVHAVTDNLKRDAIIILRLITEREPVNINTSKRFSVEEMKEQFGYDTSFYSRYYAETGKLAPNIGIYTLAPTKINNKLMNIHYYHAICLALDHEDQPDYKFYHNKPDSDLIEFYQNMFAFIFVFANKYGFKNVVMPLVGAGNFAEKYKDGALDGGSEGFLNNVWIPAFSNVIKELGEDEINLDIYFIGSVDTPAEKLGYKDLGSFPGFIGEMKLNYKETLIVNSANPHSFPGTGDLDTLDGDIGRVAAVQFFGNGLTNPCLRYNIETID